MYKLIIFVLFFSPGFFFPQKIKPMENCICYSQTNTNSLKALFAPNYALRINSNHPNIVSVSEGKISKILKHNDGTYSILIRDGDLFYAYSDVSSVAKKINTNKSVAKGTKIGRGIFSEEGNYTIKLSIFNKTDEVTNLKDYVDCRFVEKW